MKRFSILSLFVILCITVSARQVDMATLRQVSAFYFSAATGTKAPVADELELAVQMDNPTLCIPAVYAFNMPGGGFMIVSASDCVEPVLAYSPDGKIDPSHISPNLQFLLDSYTKTVSANQNNEGLHHRSAIVAHKWQELEDETFMGNPSKSSVLIQTKWGQGDKNEPTYNCMCPMDGDKHSITGCVAVAMSQIIKYWNYPVQGGTTNNMKPSVVWNGQRIIYDFTQDSNKFDYENMPNKLKYTSPWEQRHATGKLFLAVGVVCKMDWSAESSSASSSNAFAGFTKYFAYANDCQYQGLDEMGQENWINMLRSEIRDCARPVYISARTAPDEEGETAGHAFVACGVSGTDSNKIYLNLGWDGSENGFYTQNPVSDMAETGGWVFNQDMAMIHHIHPNTMGINETQVYTAEPAYPNPASEYVMIPAGLRLNATLAVYALDGKLVETLVVSGGVQEYRLDVSSYPAGTYVYRLNGETGRIVKM